MPFGEKLKKLRIEKNMTQKELGKIIGVSDRVIGYYESNDRFPKDEKVLKSIGEYFNISIDYLLGIVDTPYLINKSHNKLPTELQDIRVEYLTIAKEIQDKKIPPEDIKKILDVLKKNK